MYLAIAHAYAVPKGSQSTPNPHGQQILMGQQYGEPLLDWFVRAKRPERRSARAIPDSAPSGLEKCGAGRPRTRDRKTYIGLAKAQRAKGFERVDVTFDRPDPNTTRRVN
jgi:hypothetical protein